MKAVTEQSKKQAKIICIITNGIIISTLIIHDTEIWSLILILMPFKRQVYCSYTKIKPQLVTRYTILIVIKKNVCSHKILNHTVKCLLNFPSFKTFLCLTLQRGVPSMALHDVTISWSGVLSGTRLTVLSDFSFHLLNIYEACVELRHLSPLNLWLMSKCQY
jgi:hypothetical protein